LPASIPAKRPTNIQKVSDLNGILIAG
jgi:hypothetical protein